jgi:hypothetical protein
MKKTFDCVAMKRRGAEKINAQIAGMIPQQELKFWQTQTEMLRQKQRALCNKRQRERTFSKSGAMLRPSAR